MSLPILEETKPYKEWSQWKSDEVTLTLTKEEINQLGHLCAVELCEIHGKGMPWYMKAWLFLDPLSYKQLNDMLNEDKPHDGTTSQLRRVREGTV